MFQAPAFAKNQVTYPFRKTAAEAINVQVGIDLSGNGPSPPKDMCSLSARWSASPSPHHILLSCSRSYPPPHDFKLEATTLRCL